MHVQALLSRVALFIVYRRYEEGWCAEDAVFTPPGQSSVSRREARERGRPRGQGEV